MRWVICIVALCAAMGCRSQSTPLTNPFLAPDRVPPPATRTPLPGTAQPYYPTDVVPGGPAPAGSSGVATTPTPAYTSPTAPLQTAPLPTTPLQTAPVTPPGGWGQPATTVTPYGVPTSGYRPIGNSPTDSMAVRINLDNQSLRFDAVPNNNPNDILQVAANQQMAAAAPYVYTPPLATTTPGTVQPAQFASTTVPGTASDGFRPQGSGASSNSSAPTRLAGIQSGATALARPVAPQENPAHFGFDPTYRWLRGQLQYYPETGYWGLRYIALEGSPDSYGGVVVIANPEVLAGVQPGEYLLVQGFLESQDNFDGTFLPIYTVEGIQRQR